MARLGFFDNLTFDRAGGDNALRSLAPAGRTGRGQGKGSTLAEEKDSEAYRSPIREGRAITPYGDGYQSGQHIDPLQNSVPVSRLLAVWPTIRLLTLPLSWN